MKINVINVINLLLAKFSTINIVETPTNEAEIHLAERIETLLISSMDEFNPIEFVEKDTLDFEDRFRTPDAIPIEDTIWPEREEPSDVCTADDDLSYDYKRRAVEFWRSGKKKISVLKPCRRILN